MEGERERGLGPPKRAPKSGCCCCPPPPLALPAACCGPIEDDAAEDDEPAEPPPPPPLWKREDDSLRIDKGREAERPGEPALALSRRSGERVVCAAGASRSRLSGTGGSVDDLGRSLVLLPATGAPAGIGRSRSELEVGRRGLAVADWAIARRSTTTSGVDDRSEPEVIIVVVVVGVLELVANLGLPGTLRAERRLVDEPDPALADAGRLKRADFGPLAEAKDGKYEPGPDVSARTSSSSSSSSSMGGGV